MGIRSQKLENVHEIIKEIFRKDLERDVFKKISGWSTGYQLLFSRM